MFVSFCNRTWETTKSGFSLHERLCEKNPNKREHNWCGKNILTKLGKECPK